jgi:methionine synthase II (cobalamin-independent)|tara:strand:+ start:692 stop:1738 length:1047 start_codon:yes stop_codon:yes gene_type:complete
MATAIGSMPHAEPSAALDLVFSSIPDAPMWPQLSQRALREQMEIQYSEGLPRIVVDDEKGRMFLDTSGDYYEDLAAFYEGYMAMEESGDCSAGAIGPDYAAGISALEARLQALSAKPLIVKCQTTGPISFALTTVDENKRAIYYNEEFVDVVVKGLAMKCRWQIQKFRPYAENVLCFIDEPILSAFGSSTYVSVQREDVIAQLSEVVGAVHAEDAIAGIHCCGNTEWSVLVDAGVDIISFDAYDHGETVALYPEHMKKHLVDRKNALAWGVVPTSAAVRDETSATLAERFEKLVDRLANAAGIDKQIIYEQAFVTPSCGTGSMGVPDAERVLELLRETSTALREKHGF